MNLSQTLTIKLCFGNGVRQYEYHVLILLKQDVIKNVSIYFALVRVRVVKGSEVSSLHDLPFVYCDSFPVLLRIKILSLPLNSSRSQDTRKFCFSISSIFIIFYPPMFPPLKPMMALDITQTQFHGLKFILQIHQVQLAIGVNIFMGKIESKK